MKNLSVTRIEQSGMAIVMAMVFLLVLTVLGITSTNSTILTEKMSQNMRDSISAFEAADSALGDGEAKIQNLTAAPTVVTSCTAAPCNVVWQMNALSNPSTQSNSWWQANGQTYSSSVVNVAQQPMYIIELFSFVPYDLSPTSAAAGRGSYYFRITARGVGLTSNTVVNVQSIYSTQIN